MGTVTFQKVDVDGIGVDRGYVKVNETTDDRLAHSLDPARDEDALSGKFGFSHLAITFSLRRTLRFSCHNLVRPALVIEAQYQAKIRK